ACDNDSGGGLASQIELVVEAGETYTVRIGGGIGGAEGDGVLNVCTFQEVAANNNCDSPAVVGNGVSAFSTLDATSTGPGACTQTVNDVWFSYTAACDGVGDGEEVLLTLSNCEGGGSFDAPGGGVVDGAMVLYDADLAMVCDNLADAEIACNDDACGGGSPAQIQFPVVTAGNYLIRVGGFGNNANGEWDLNGNRVGQVVSDQGSGNLAVACSEDPDDICIGAQEVNPAGPSAGPIAIQLDNCTAFSDVAPICGGATPGNAGARWLQLNGTGSIWTIEVCNLDPSNNFVFIDTNLFVYCSDFFGPDCTVLNCAVDDPIVDNNPNCPFTETFDLATLDGVAYYVLVEGVGDDGGSCVGTIDVTFTEGGASSDIPCFEQGACCLPTASTAGTTCMDDVVREDCIALGGDFVACQGTCAELECFVADETNDTTLLQHCSDTPLGGVVRCQGGGVETENWFYRTFTGVPNGFKINSVTFGLDDALDNGIDGYTEIIVCVYDGLAVTDLTFDATTGFANECATLCRTIQITDDMMDTLQTFEIGGTITGGQFTVEIYQPCATCAGLNNGSRVQFAANNPGDMGCIVCPGFDPTGCGENADTWLRSLSCGIGSPVTMTQIGFNGNALILKVNGNQP
ncbi:MAG: hypothetical protein ACYTGC_16255, partial [Planctomycetota bacterium]